MNQMKTTWRDLLDENLTQVEIATRMNSHQSAVSNWLAGRRLPKRQTLAALANAMSVDEEILGKYILAKWLAQSR
jgi:transcriptional regulator with XRE-family HTH domain